MGNKGSQGPQSPEGPIVDSVVARHGWDNWDDAGNATYVNALNTLLNALRTAFPNKSQADKITLIAEPSSLNQEERGADVAVGEASLDNPKFPKMSVSSAEEKDTGQRNAPAARGRGDKNFHCRLNFAESEEGGRRGGDVQPTHRGSEKGNDSPRLDLRPHSQELVPPPTQTTKVLVTYYLPGPGEAKSSTRSTEPGPGLLQLKSPLPRSEVQLPTHLFRDTSTHLKLFQTPSSDSMSCSTQWRIGRREHRDVSRWPDGPPGLT
ncbi:unnamed protein product [Pleuronectes platessa]|uniref:Uncharacterized protein n=1 Tax=Pleuronectes platessa TaxID=8262 RepID=A0A9N7Y147_PLEPL|nr:unnamed protein product [Pleuronectes platessa]